MIEDQKSFLELVEEVVQEHLSDEQFGVSELAQKMRMSRSNLLRKIKKSTSLSVSQYIRQIRLSRGMEMLMHREHTVSEIAYRVGFSSTSYFIKCFHDQYGYPPGEAINQQKSELSSVDIVEKSKRPFPLWAWTVLSLISFAIILYVIIGNEKQTTSTDHESTPDKSIAVLPFINDSNDSSNVYIINGLMESILNNLQKIKSLRVVSRTSAEKYRYSELSIPEIARELNVQYFVEGSGQKIDDKILLNIQLIDATADRHLWAEQYDRDVNQIFLLQKEVARKIVDNIEVVITPDEAERIDKLPTYDPVAYDHFLKGLDRLQQGTREGVLESIPYFKQAIEKDQHFAQAYATMSIAYYFLDAFQANKIYSEEINTNADIALLHDSKLAQSLIAKGLYYINIDDRIQAIPYLEKALEYNPNSAFVINILSDFYTTYLPNTEKYLEYALRGERLDIGSHDSTTASFIYLHVSNALVQSGFVEKAMDYIKKAISFDSENLFAAYVRAYILYAQNGNLEQTKNILLGVLEKDTTRIDVLQEVGKICFYMKDYKSAYQYYGRFLEIRETRKLDVYPGENAKIALVLKEMGEVDKSDRLLAEYKMFAENDQSIYRHLSLSAYFSLLGEADNAIDHLLQFSEESKYHIWTILFLGSDPIFADMKDDPRFQEILIKLESKFWENHDSIRISLKEKGLI